MQLDRQVNTPLWPNRNAVLDGRAAVPKTVTMQVTREPGGGHRWVAIGNSSDADSRTAGEGAAHDALTEADPRLLLVFCSALHDPAAVLAGIRTVNPDVPLVGCSTTSVIGPDGPSRGPGVAVFALGGPGFSIVTAAARNATEHRREAGAAVASCVGRLDDRPHELLVLITDGLMSGQEDVLAGAYSMVGASVPLVGGSSSPDPSAMRTFQFHGDEVLTDAVVGAAIASDGPLGVGLRHGWRKVGQPMIVTKSAGGDVFTLDDQPALTAYLRRMDAPADAYEDANAFERFALTRPIGVRRRSGEEVRSVSSPALLSEGWLRSSGEVPEGCLIWPMAGDEQSVLAAAAGACQDAVDALGGPAPLGMVAFDCESHGRLLGPEGMRHEVGQMIDKAGSTPLAGLYTWGEIARIRGINGFHNQTLVVLAVG
jgi:hypothetical protein